MTTLRRWCGLCGRPWGGARRGLPAGAPATRPIRGRHSQRTGIIVAVRGWADYDLEGSIGVVVNGHRYRVVLPNEFLVSFQEYPERQLPNAKATVSMSGRTLDPPPWAPSRSAARISIATASSGPIHPPSPSRCGGIGWHFHLDSVEEPQLFGLWVTVPSGDGNGTWGLNLQPSLPWVRAETGFRGQARTRSADGTYRVSFAELEEGHWRWAAQAVGGARPWLSSFELDVSTDGFGLGAPPPTLRIAYQSEAAEGALQADLRAIRRGGVQPG